MTRGISHRRTRYVSTPRTGQLNAALLGSK